MKYQQHEWFIIKSQHTLLLLLCLMSWCVSSFQLQQHVIPTTVRDTIRCPSSLLLFAQESGQLSLVDDYETGKQEETEKQDCLLPHSRRKFLFSTAFTTTLFGLPVVADDQINHPIDNTSEDVVINNFRSNGFDRQEYTNSIVASRDTNISPKEVYDTVLSQLSSSSKNKKTNLRALDLGAGAGVSTQVLWDMGYHTIDAVDWSNKAWEQNVVENGSCPSSVTFYEMDDERFLRQWRQRKDEKYDVVVFHFAVNADKAFALSRELLVDDGGILLAPVNVQTDYWLKQVYTLMDSSGKILWTAGDVGAWSVQFQPDVTQPTCQGIWCAPFNGFQRL